MYRGWINQPSTLQPLHHLHGTNVLVGHAVHETRVWFLSGDVISMIVPEEVLSKGWLEQETPRIK